MIPGRSTRRGQAFSASSSCATFVSAEIPRAERKLGEILKETVNHNGAKGVGNKVLPTLPDDVSKMARGKTKLTQQR
jgi:hypothetical protein